MVMLNQATTPPVSTSSISHSNHSFDLRVLQVRETQWRTRLGAALDIIEEGDLELVSKYIIPMLSDRSKVVRQKVHREMVSLFGTYFPPFISFARREMFWMKEKERELL
jgi:hypothetical protein